MRRFERRAAVDCAVTWKRFRPANKKGQLALAED
jgi:hypothetical protein